jgi:chromosome partitioning protein
VHDRLNPQLFLFGVVLTMFDSRTKLAAEVVNEVSAHFPKEKFEAIIPHSVRLAEAPSYGKTILEHDARSPGAKAYQRLAENVLARAAVMERVHG